MAEAPITNALSRDAGFPSRYFSIFDRLVKDHEVHLFYLEQDPVQFVGSVRQHRSVVPVTEIPIPVMPRSRAGRARQAVELLARRPEVTWERDLVDAVGASEPDLVIVFAVVCRYAFRSLPDRFPTIGFVEEDLSRHPEWARSSLLGKSLSAIGRYAEHRSLRGLRTAVVISPEEKAWASKTFPRSRIEVVPHSIDLRYWTDHQPCEPRERPSLLVVGNMSVPRNAEGLAEVLAALNRTELASSLEVRVASSSPLHEALSAYENSITYLSDVPDLRAAYSSATAALVPSFVVSGAKTTILQGWATRCAVVTTTSAARSVGGRDGVDVVAGDGPEEVVEGIRRVVESQELRDRLIAAGERSLWERHSEAAIARALDGAIARTFDPARRGERARSSLANGPTDT